MTHWFALSRLSAAEKFGYILQTLKMSARWRLKAIQCYGYHLVGKTLPPELLAFYVDEILFRHKYRREQARYRPQPYHGRVDYFRAGQGANDIEGWRSITNRELVVHEIPGTHLTMIEDKGAPELARSLKSCLEEAAGGRQRVSYRDTYTNDPKTALPAMALQRSAMRR